MTEITELQQLKNDFALLQRRVEGYDTPSQHLVASINGHYQKLNTHQRDLQIQIDTFKDAIARINSLDKRFIEIEKFMRYLLDYFDPAPKAKREMEKLKKLLKEKDDEIEKTRSILKEALK